VRPGPESALDYGKPLTFGVFVIPDATAPQRAIESAVAADELGFHLVGVQDHPYQRRFYDAFTLLTAMATRTERITLFPDVANLPLRPPAMLAKAAASIDILCGGRFELGLGAGGFWDAIEAYGGPRRSPGESVEALDVLVELATEHGMDTFMLPQDGEDPRTHLRKFVGDVIPRVRDRVAGIRGSR